MSTVKVEQGNDEALTDSERTAEEDNRAAIEHKYRNLTYEQCCVIIEALERSSAGNLFSEKIDLEYLNRHGAQDYLEYVRFEDIRDLKTIREKIAGREYADCPCTAIYDADLCFRNATVYNREGSTFNLGARALRKSLHAISHAFVSVETDLSRALRGAQD